MNSSDDRLQRVFRDVFNDDELSLTDQLSSETMKDWDSFAQVRLMIELQEEFGLQFTTEEAISATSVASIRSLLASKL
jgi:acyl carrier protein